jgi:hypothetical protein
METVAASALSTTRLDQHAGCARVKQPAEVRYLAAMAQCDSGLETGQIPMALRGHDPDGVRESSTHQQSSGPACCGS